MASVLEPSKVTPWQTMNLLSESLSTIDSTRKAALQKLEKMLGSSTFMGCFMESFQSHDPTAFKMNVKKFLENLLRIMMAADGHPDIWEKICLLLERTVNAVGSRYDCFKTLLPALLKGVLDENELVQSVACCSALGRILDEFPEYSGPHLHSIVETLATALISKYQPTKLSELYKAIAIMANSVGSQLTDEPEFIPLLLTSLMTLWEALQNDENHTECIPPLLGCISTIVKATKSGCLLFLEPLFHDCISLLNQHSGKQDKDDDMTFAALELLTGLVGEMAAVNLEGLIIESNVTQLLIQKLQDSSPKVRRASFNLFSELVESCFDDAIRPHLPDCMPILSENLMPDFLTDYEEPSMSDKAFSVLGKIVVKLGGQMKDYISIVLPQLLVLVSLQNENQSDAAIILGRLGLFCFNEIAPFYNQFAQQWCASFGQIKDEDMKESSFRGMLRLITTNLAGISNDDFIFSFCKKVYSWLESYHHGEILKQMLIQVLWDFRSGVGEGEWRRLIGDDQVVWEE